MTTFTTRITAMYTLQQPDPNYVVNALWAVTGVDWRPYRIHRWQHAVQFC
jgi:hypothetical protein